MERMLFGPKKPRIVVLLVSPRNHGSWTRWLYSALLARKRSVRSASLTISSGIGTKMLSGSLILFANDLSDLLSGKDHAFMGGDVGRTELTSAHMPWRTPAD